MLGYFWNVTHVILLIFILFTGISAFGQTPSVEEDLQTILQREMVQSK